ncbi:Uncharacterised protein [Vibrio cholerae]|nr:Uncharacterised protein [Vibrio cholerae]
MCRWLTRFLKKCCLPFIVVARSIRKLTIMVCHKHRWLW